MKWLEQIAKYKEVIFAVAGLGVILLQAVLVMTAVDIDRIVHSNTDLLQQNAVILKERAQLLEQKAASLSHIDDTLNSSLKNGQRLTALALDVEKLEKDIDQAATVAHNERMELGQEVSGFGIQLQKHVAGGREFLESIRNATPVPSPSPP